MSTLVPVSARLKGLYSAVVVLVVAISLLPAPVDAGVQPTGDDPPYPTVSFDVASTFDDESATLTISAGRASGLCFFLDGVVESCTPRAATEEATTVSYLRAGWYERFGAGELTVRTYSEGVVETLGNSDMMFRVSWQSTTTLTVIDPTVVLSHELARSGTTVRATNRLPTGFVEGSTTLDFNDGHGALALADVPVDIEADGSLTFVVPDVEPGWYRPQFIVDGQSLSPTALFVTPDRTVAFDRAVLAVGSSVRRTISAGDAAISCGFLGEQVLGCSSQPFAWADDVVEVQWSEFPPEYRGSTYTLRLYGFAKLDEGDVGAGIDFDTPYLSSASLEIAAVGAAPTTVATLPNTGDDTTSLALAGMVLLVAGAGLTLLTRRRAA